MGGLLEGVVASHAALPHAARQLSGRQLSGRRLRCGSVMVVAMTPGEPEQAEGPSPARGRC